MLWMTLIAIILLIVILEVMSRVISAIVASIPRQAVTPERPSTSGDTLRSARGEQTAEEPLEPPRRRSSSSRRQRASASPLRRPISELPPSEIPIDIEEEDLFDGTGLTESEAARYYPGRPGV